MEKTNELAIVEHHQSRNAVIGGFPHKMNTNPSLGSIKNKDSTLNSNDVEIKPDQDELEACKNISDINISHQVSI